MVTVDTIWSTLFPLLTAAPTSRTIVSK